MEIDTSRFIGTIWRWKVLILFMTAIFVTVGALYSYFAPKVYRVRTIIEASSFESPVSLATIINQKYFDEQVAKKLNIEASILPKMIANNTVGTNLVIVSVSSKNAEQAQQILSAFDEVVISDGAELHDGRQRIASLFQKKVKNSLLELEPIMKQQASDYSVSNNDVASRLSRRMLLDGFLSYLTTDYENDMNLFNLKERKVIIPPKVLRPPLWPRPLLIVSFTAIAGFLFGIFVALWREKRIIPA